FAALAGLAFLLAAVGIYSVLSYSVRSRVQEIGVRIAIGASPIDIIRLVITEGMRPALLGIAVGAVGAVRPGRRLGKTGLWSESARSADFWRRRIAAHDGGSRRVCNTGISRYTRASGNGFAERVDAWLLPSRIHRDDRARGRQRDCPNDFVTAGMDGPVAAD